jgi:hypothetical protein
MRNLKKILALVLALVMTMSVMSIASAATAGTTYSDDASITQFDEAIQVLTALGIYKGDEGGFRPNSTITRAEAAALVYRVISTDVTDKQTSIYADYNKFDDVKSTDWFAGYVNFCANGQYIVGNGDGTFNYNGNITGYELLAIILRALGYGQNAEYQGTGWEIKTATDAKKLGIIANINESTLGQAQTRAAVAEMLFQGLTCTQTVDYSALLGYTSGGSTLTGKSTHGTLGFEKFGLRAKYATSADLDDENTDTSVLIGTGKFQLTDLTKRNPAIADTSVEHVDEFNAAEFNAEAGVINSVIVDNKYGEPVAFWYATSIVNKATNPAGEIEVRFNPVASYSTTNDESVLFAGFDAKGISTTVSPVNYNIDGVNYDGDADYTEDDDGNIILYKSLADKKTDTGDRTVKLENHGGKGTSTELFVADGTKFVVVKKSYVDTVKTEYATKYLRAMELTNYTLDDAEYKQQSADIVSDLEKDTVVLFNVYGEDALADLSTVHPADSKVVTLTNSYVLSEDLDNAVRCEGSYFMVGSTKYEYDCNAMDDLLYESSDQDEGEDQLPLDRTVLLEKDPTEDTQKVYFDDFGYVIYSVSVINDKAEGYMVVTTTEYGGYDKDNGYYLNISGYTADGKAVTFKGAFSDDRESPVYVYGTSGSARDYEAEIGIYYYQKDADTDFVSLTLYEDGESAAEAIYAGDPDAIDSDAVADSETVFVVANYSTKGAITGYDVYTGIKNIKDLKDADLESKTSTVIYPDVEWSVNFVDSELLADKGNGEDEGNGAIDLVLVMGAKQSTDVKLSSSVATVPEVFYLLDEVPEMQFAEYNTYKVIMDGKVTTINVSVDAEGSATDYTTIFEGTGFYKVTAWAGDYVYDADKIDATEITYAGVDVLTIAADNGSMWAYASCHEGNGEENGGYVVLANSCKLYDLTGGKITEIKAEDLIVDEDLADVYGDGENALGYTGVKGVVGDWDAYGFATVIYVVDTDAID